MAERSKTGVNIVKKNAKVGGEQAYEALLCFHLSLTLLTGVPITSSNQPWQRLLE